MNLFQVKSILENLQQLTFAHENGDLIPAHFHVTEVGQITRDFIDCGGTRRHEQLVNFQLWSTESDINHRLAPQKLKEIIEVSERVLNIVDAEIEIEFQQDTIGKYKLGFNGIHFILHATNTACLASDQCGIPAKKTKLSLSTIGIQDANTSCTPNGTCC